MNENENQEAEVAETVSEQSEVANSEEAAAEAAPVEDSQATDESSSEQEASSEEQEAPAEPKEDLKWYVVHTYSGYEKKAKQSLQERIKTAKMETHFGDVLIPSENVVEMVKGKKRTSNKRFFPGYILVNMNLTNETWHLVRSTPKVTGFVGGRTNPPAVPEKDVRRLTKQIEEGTLRPKMSANFEKGENVRVIDGPFANFNGVVDEVKPEKGKLRVLVSIFGRSTPVELEFMQVEKT